MTLSSTSNDIHKGSITRQTIKTFASVKVHVQVQKYLKVYQIANLICHLDTVTSTSIKIVLSRLAHNQN